jgi:phosphohistidine phosphatase SixA
MIGVLLAAPAVADEAGWEAARQPGAVLLMRHALAPGTGDPADFELGDCSTQRNLSDQGREQARRIGEALRRNGIAIDPVLTSQWCRCRETAELLDLGPVDDLPALNSFFQDRSTAPAQTEEALSYLRTLPDDRQPLLVTHQVNISALAGTSTRSGEVIVVDITPEGEVDILGRILVDP